MDGAVQVRRRLRGVSGQAFVRDSIAVQRRPGTLTACYATVGVLSLRSFVAELWSISFDPLAAAELAPALHSALAMKPLAGDMAFCLEAARGFATCGDFAAVDTVVQQMWERSPKHKTTSLALLVGVGACRRSGKFQQAVEYIM